MLRTRREMLRDIGALVLGSTALGKMGCSGATPVGAYDAVPGGPIHEFLYNVLRVYCDDRRFDEFEWVIGDRQPISDADRSNLEYLRSRIEAVFEDGCEVSPLVIETQTSFERPMIIFGSRETSYVLQDILAEEDVPPAGTGLVKTYRFIDGLESGPEALCLVGRDVAARRIAAEVMWGFIMSYMPPTDDDGDRFLECNATYTTYDAETGVYHSDARFE